MPFSKTDRGICYNVKNILGTREMDKNKSKIILKLYDDLVEHKRVNINEFRDKYGVSISTFYRYMNTVREYVAENLFLNIAYDARTESYKLTEVILDKSKDNLNCEIDPD